MRERLWIFREIFFDFIEKWKTLISYICSELVNRASKKRKKKKTLCICQKLPTLIYYTALK